MYHCNRTTTIVRDDMGTPYDVYGVIVRGEDGATIFSAEDLTFHRNEIDAFYMQLESFAARTDTFS